MEEKKIDSIRPGMTSSSSHVASVYGNDYVELVWQNGQILVQGESSPCGTRKRPSCIGYSINSSSEANDECPCITKRARINTLYSLFDSNSHQNPQHSYPSDFKYTTKSNVNRSFSNGNKLEAKESNSKPTGGTTQLCSSNASQKHELGSDQRMKKVNFSNFLRPALFFRSSYQLNSATRTQPTNGGVLARVEEVKNSKALDNSAVIDSAKKGSHGLIIDGVQHREDQTVLDRHKAKATPISVAKGDHEGTLPDEQSEAIGHNRTAIIRTQKEKGKFCVGEFYNGPLMASSSLCSLEASNDLTFRSRKHEDTEDSNFISDNDEEAEDVMNMKETPPREGSRGKKMRNPDIHNLSERKRRDKINKKMRALKELIPNCNKMDKASMLDDAIEYLKTLKLQLQVMLMGSGLCSMPMMMLRGGMNIRPGGLAIPCSLPPQFPNIPHIAPHITENTLQMLPFPNQILPIQFPVSHPPPFIPLPPMHLPTLNDSLPKNSHLNAQLLCRPMQPSNQGTN